MEKSRGSIEKLEIGAQLETFLYVTVPIVTVLKNSPFNRVSVITNFVIRKREKNQKKTRKLKINMHYLRGTAIPAGHVQNLLSDSYKIKRGGGSPRCAPSRKISPSWL